MLVKKKFGGGGDEIHLKERPFRYFILFFLHPSLPCRISHESSFGVTGQAALAQSSDA